ncbi:MAG: hypothetical protein HY334_07870 [Armatimonadetes bacterium]|nr:hypothetical protein [Armatimonadota bacterium]
MDAYDSRGVTLDPGLTLLALRALREREGHYPFLDGVRPRFGWGQVLSGLKSWRNGLEASGAGS